MDTAVRLPVVMTSATTAGWGPDGAGRVVWVDGGVSFGELGTTVMKASAVAAGPSTHSIR
jgi:hypothetical protein